MKNSPLGLFILVVAIVVAGSLYLGSAATVAEAVAQATRLAPYIDAHRSATEVRP